MLQLKFVAASVPTKATSVHTKATSLVILLQPAPPPLPPSSPVFQSLPWQDVPLLQTFVDVLDSNFQGLKVQKPPSSFAENGLMKLKRYPLIKPK